MSSRTYLSIGDVLTLLREEFPDVTISKIRFLESQGLVNPERSPSGYRKFFDHDVERLRWVLRQQREHFLPLKVIRDRLADGELDDAGPRRGPNGKPSGTRPSQPARRLPALAPQQPTKADEEAMARILADASRRAARLPEATPRPDVACRWWAGGDTAAPPATAAVRARSGRRRRRPRPPERGTPAAQAAPCGTRCRRPSRRRRSSGRRRPKGADAPTGPPLAPRAEAPRPASGPHRPPAEAKARKSAAPAAERLQPAADAGRVTAW